MAERCYWYCCIQEATHTVSSVSYGIIKFNVEMYKHFSTSNNYYYDRVLIYILVVLYHIHPKLDLVVFCLVRIARPARIH